MKTRLFIVSIAMLFILAFGVSCDSNNNSIAQDDDMPVPGPAPTSGRTVVKGKIIDPGDRCKGVLDGFDVGDSVTFTLFNNSSNNPDGTIQNDTKSTSAKCNINTTLSDEPLFSYIVCPAQDSSIPGISNGDLMSLLISFSWMDGLLDGVPKTATVINKDISFDELKDVPCGMAEIESITASN